MWLAGGFERGTRALNATSQMMVFLTDLDTRTSQMIYTYV